MKKQFLVFILFLIIIIFFVNYTEDYKKVKDVIDGDTIKLENNRIIRLIGINAPETNEECYQESKEELEELVKGKSVRLESDTKNKDGYGRLLRYVYVDDLFINSEMIRLGLAKFEEVGPNIKYSELFLEMEEKARKAGRCIWD